MKIMKVSHECRCKEPLSEFEQYEWEETGRDNGWLPIEKVPAEVKIYKTFGGRLIFDLIVGEGDNKRIWNATLSDFPSYQDALEKVFGYLLNDCDNDNDKQ